MWITGKVNSVVLLSKLLEPTVLYKKLKGSGEFIEIEDADFRKINDNVHEIRIKFDEPGEWVVLSISGTAQSIKTITVVNEEDLVQEVDLDGVFKEFSKTNDKIDLVKTRVTDVSSKIDNKASDLTTTINSIDIEFPEVDVKDGPDVVVGETISNKKILIHISAIEGTALTVEYRLIDNDEIYSTPSESLVYIGDNIYLSELVLARGVYELKVTDLNKGKSTYRRLEVTTVSSDKVERYVYDTNMKVSAMNKRLKLKGM